MLKNCLKSNKYRNNLYHDENQYLNLIESIIEENNEFIGRNGSTLSVFGAAMHFNLENNIIPLLTTKKLAWKTCLKELLWFIKGDTSNKNLKKQNVHIWDANGNREFLDSRGLYEYEEDDLGPIYGFQWRHFNANYKDCNSDYSGKGIDQLNNIINQLKDPETRNSRRLIMSAWNPCQLNKMALPPCHVLCQFNVTNDNKLSCSLYQRSGDVGLGVPFNIASYCFLTHLLAHHCNLEGYEFIHYLGNTHIYDDHIEKLKTQVIREPFIFPKLEIIKKYDNIEDYNLDDFKIINYNYHENIKLEMRQ
jgi:thymidylate synthase|tara:strand:+ start:75 stop:992 length:918 start_codon:yes stop_codon:yes gene_type:complete